MAAQKLTKGRFVQIIIMLTLLIVAFFWRTFTYNTEKVVSCKLQQLCTFYVNNAQFIAQFNQQGIKVVTPDDSWEINDAVATKSEPNTWELKSGSPRIIEVTNKNDDQTTRMEFVVQSSS